MPKNNFKTKKARKGTVFASDEVMTKDSPIRPVDLLGAVFHNDDKALFAAFSRRGKKASKAAPEKERTFSRGASGKVSVVDKEKKQKTK